MATSTASESIAVSNLVQTFARAWNNHDARAISDLYTHDGEHTNVMGMKYRGPEEIEKLHAPHFKTVWAFSTLDIKNIEIKFIKDDVAAADVWWNLEGLRTPGGEERAARNGLINLTAINRDGEWKILLMHNMDLPSSATQKC